MRPKNYVTKHAELLKFWHCAVSEAVVRKYLDLPNIYSINFCLLVGFSDDFRHKFYTQKEDSGMQCGLLFSVIPSTPVPRFQALADERSRRRAERTASTVTGPSA